jgi:methylmalonyl-CoA/ethylmalonyl-CoA epimerase
MMQNLGLNFHHFGLAVKKEDRALVYLKALGYRISELTFDPEQNVNLRMCHHATEPDVELVMPGEGEGPLTPIFKRFDELVYHLCYEVEDLEVSLDAMDAAGLSVIPVAPPKPAILFDNRKVSFYRVRGFGTIELLEK